MEKLKKTIVIVTLMMPLLCFGQKEQVKTFTGVKSIKMNNSSANCKIQKSTDQSVTVKLRYTYNDGDVEHTMDQEGDRLVIRETFHANNVRGNSEWILSVPDGTTIKYTTGSGSIEAANTKLDINATTGSGSFMLNNITGTLNITAGSGDLDLDSFNGELYVNIGSGSATIQNSSGDFDLNCGSGNINVNQSKAAFKINTGSGRVLAKGINLTGASRFNSGSGSSTVVLASALQHDIVVNSGSGDAELNFNGNPIAGEIIMEASKEHGRIDAPFAFDKTEEIVRGGNDNVTIRKTVAKGKSINKIRVGTGSGDAVLKQ